MRYPSRWVVIQVAVVGYVVVSGRCEMVVYKMSVVWRLRGPVWHSISASGD